METGRIARRTLLLWAVAAAGIGAGGLLIGCRGGDVDRDEADEAQPKGGGEKGEANEAATKGAGERGEANKARIKGDKNKDKDQDEEESKEAKGQRKTAH